MIKKLLCCEYILFILLIHAFCLYASHSNLGVEEGQLIGLYDQNDLDTANELDRDMIQQLAYIRAGKINMQDIDKEDIEIDQIVRVHITIINNSSFGVYLDYNKGKEHIFSQYYFIPQEKIEVVNLSMYESDVGCSLIVFEDKDIYFKATVFLRDNDVITVEETNSNELVIFHNKQKIGNIEFAYQDAEEEEEEEEEDQRLSLQNAWDN
tara:strand:+ start:7515 stop:8141 length:627 start_codon:yes stop_codon:yes gene_type:complete